MNLLFFVVLAILAVAAFLIGWFIARVRVQAQWSRDLENARLQIQEVQQQLSRYQTQSELYQQQYQDTNAQLQQKEQKIEQLIAENHQLHALNEQLKQKLSEQKEEIQEIRKQFHQEFENLANRIFEEKSKKFTEQNTERIREILNPLKEKIGEFEKKVEESNKENIQNHSALKTELEHLKQLNQQITEEARNLTKALKGESKTRGIWGEMILKRILELSGLEKGREYVQQESFTGDHGNRLQPDVVIYLPGDKYLIIDAKVSLVAYENYVHSDNPQEQDQLLRQHVQSIRNHIDGLSKKNYPNIHGQQSLDFVFLFMPIEAAFLLALKVDNDLYEYAFHKNIIIVGPSNLLATLKLVATIWQQEKQQKNAQQIAEEAKKMLDKFSILCQRLEELGDRIRKTQEVYESTMITLTGRGNLLNIAKRVGRLGVSPSKALPQALLQAAEDEEEDEQVNGQIQHE
ncbi:DNA recombination protein RmuC [Thermoflavifilum thermophilum]|uniref:DNA recombination protein RmuC n=1 Tax=Thermoflavifilum thermophilum TaxID=1393122 RepID=A0A1I7NC94_9BACT|nr:DNA recombination protein RmuC [Thermoflavifilum thermophilum]SFV32282.1 DNA recombination protein RmuC [Thermoflavifilum thermophilum]